MSAIETIRGAGPVLLTCEHASQHMPAGYAWPAADQRLMGTHWAFDLGARELTLELAAALGAPAILSRFSRLLVDPNRPEDSSTLFRDEAEGEPVMLNVEVGESERERRLGELYRPYHTAVDGLMSGSEASLAFSVHTFTPLYEGRPRSLEVGVLYTGAEDEANVINSALRVAGWDSRLNEPYSGMEGLMYCVDHHAGNHGKAPIEIEVRQDLAMDLSVRGRLVDVLTDVLRTVAGT